MNITEHLQYKLTGDRIDILRPLIRVANISKAPDAKYSYADRYVLYAELGLEFSFDGTDLDKVLDRAKAQMIRLLYRNVLATLEDIEYALHNFEVQQAISLIEDLKKDLNGEKS